MLSLSMIFEVGVLREIQRHLVAGEVRAGIADSPKDRISECVPLEEDVFLLEVLKTAQGNNVLVCVDRGKVRYRLKIPSESYMQIPDGQGGFLSTVDWPSGDYSPVKLNHYDRAGRMDRTLELSGREVTVEVFGSVADRDTGLCTLYGTAVANSRKVYTAFAMTLDADLNVTGLDVRKIDRLIGVSGTLVHPQVCLVCGASGSAAFMAGIAQSKTIIAVNTDEKAPLAKQADAFVCGDWTAVLEELARLL